MTRVLKTSGFVGLATMMAVGLYQFVLLEGGGALPPGRMGGHAHLGVLSILAIVVGFTVESYGLTGRVRSVVTGLYVVGQWALPLTFWTGITGGVGIGMPTTFVWGLCSSSPCSSWRGSRGPATAATAVARAALHRPTTDPTLG